MKSIDFVRLIFVCALLSKRHKFIICMNNDPENNSSPSDKTTKDQSESDSPSPSDTNRSDPTSIQNYQVDPDYEESNESDKDEQNNPVELNIKSKNETDDFYYYNFDNISIFYAKEYRSFNSVRQNSNMIWQSSSHSDRAHKVVVKGIGSGKKKLDIYFYNREMMSFRKSGKGQPWTEVNEQQPPRRPRPPQPSSVPTFDNQDVSEGGASAPVQNVENPSNEDDNNSHDNNVDNDTINENLRRINDLESRLIEELQDSTITVVTYNDDDPTIPREIDIEGQYVSRINGDYHYQFDLNVRCNEVKYLGDTVWKRGPNEEYPIFVRIKPGRHILIKFQNYYDFFLNINGNWVRQIYFNNIPVLNRIMIIEPNLEDEGYLSGTD